MSASDKYPLSVKLRAWELVDEGCDILAAMIQATREWLDDKDHKEKPQKRIP